MAIIVNRNRNDRDMYLTMKRPPTKKTYEQTHALFLHYVNGLYRKFIKTVANFCWDAMKKKRLLSSFKLAWINTSCEKSQWNCKKNNTHKTWLVLAMTALDKIKKKNPQFSSFFVIKYHKFIYAPLFRHLPKFAWKCVLFWPLCLLWFTRTSAIVRIFVVYAWKYECFGIEVTADFMFLFFFLLSLAFFVAMPHKVCDSSNLSRSIDIELEIIWIEISSTHETGQ